MPAPNNVKPRMFKRVNAWSVRLAEPLAVPIVRLCLALRMSPNAVTLLSFAIALSAAAVFALVNSYWGLLAGALLFQFGFLFDLADGAVARITGRTSEFGAKLDGRLDKVKKAVCLAAILYGYWWWPGGRWVWLLFGIGLVVSSYGLQKVAGYFRRKAGGGPDAVQQRLRRRGILDWWDPLDTQFLLLVLAPLTGPVLAWIWLLTCIAQAGRLLQAVVFARRAAL